MLTSKLTAETIGAEEHQLLVLVDGIEHADAKWIRAVSSLTELREVSVLSDSWVNSRIPLPRMVEIRASEHKARASATGDNVLTKQPLGTRRLFVGLNSTGGQFRVSETDRERRVLAGMTVS